MRLPDGSPANDVGSGEGARLPLPQLPRILRRSLDGHTDETATASPVQGGGRASAPAAPARPGLPDPPPVHRQAEAPAGDVPAPGASATDDSAPDAEGDTEPSEGADALFRKLYPRVRDELRWELRVQRERAGMLSDPL